MPTESETCPGLERPRCDGDGDVAAVHWRVVAELALVITAPAPSAAVDHRAGILTARGNGLEAAAQAADPHGHEAPVPRRVGAERTGVVQPPAPSAAVDQCAGMLKARGERLDAAAQPDDQPGHVTLRSHGVVAELTVVVLSPAPSAAVDQCTGMRVARGNGLDA